METARGKTREEIITKLADRIDSYKKYTRPHSRMAAELAARLARRFGLAQSDVHAIAEAALLLDIGLYAMTPAYNSVPGPLSFEERLDLWRHPIIGEQQMAKREASRQAQLLVRWHHEWWNGSGYPDMLAFEDIPIGARILRAVELYSALISDRPYRAALSSDESLEALRSSAGIECDPFVVRALLALLDELHSQAIEVREETRGRDFTEQSPSTGPSTERESLSSYPASPIETPLNDSPEQRAEFERPGVQEVEPDGQTGDERSEQQVQELFQWPLSEQVEHQVEDQPQWPFTDQRELTPVEQQLEQFFEQKEDEASERMRQEPEAQTGEPSSEPIAREEIESAYQVNEASDIDAIEPATRPVPLEVSAPAPALPPIERLLAHTGPGDRVEGEIEAWNGWRRSRYNRKAILGFEASVLRQIEFRSIAIVFSGWARLDWYMKAWGKLILSNDPRPWAAAAARAMIESRAWLDEDSVSDLLADVYVPGVRLGNERLRRWFGETDAWWLDNLRRNIAAMGDETLRSQALVLGMQTGDYALSFDETTHDLKRPLTTIFWRLAGRAFAGSPGHPHNRAYNLSAEEFIRQTRADLLYINLPSAHAEIAGSEARHEWRDCWVKGTDEPEAYQIPIASVPQSKHSYLALIDRLLQEAADIRTWAIEYQETGFASVRDIIDLIKEHRQVQATYSKDLTELAGGLRNYIIVAERAPSRSAFGS